MAAIRMTVDKDEVTELLAAWRGGDASAPHRLADRVYADIHRMASRCLAGNGNVALQTTELAHEACLRVLQHPLDAVDRAHFFRIVALSMRQVLVDTVRRNTAGKRNGGMPTVGISAAAGVAIAGPESWLGVERALSELEQLDERKCRVVEMAFLLGMEQAEIARTLEISIPTVERDLRFAKAWLRERLG